LTIWDAISKGNQPKTETKVFPKSLYRLAKKSFLLLT
jgi:hypothetical protein